MRDYGVLSRTELLDLGVGPCSVKRWAAAGRLHRLYRGVYAVGHAALTLHGRWLAAVKACGPGAVLSHITAAVLWDLIRSSSSVIHVTTPGRASPESIRAHRVRSLHPDDLADVLPVRRLTRAVEQAERLQLFDMRAIEDLLARSNGRRISPLRAAIATTTGEPPRVNSDWERDLLDFCDNRDIPRPALNVAVEGYVVDALWPAKNVIVELDSYAFHRSVRAFEADREQYADLQLAGYLVLPITRLDAAAARRITRALRAR